MTRRHRTAVEGERARRLVERVFRIRELGIVLALALLIAVTAILEPRFVETASLRNLALNASIFAILAVGQTLVIITRNVDLSVGSVVGLTAFLAGDLLSKPSRAWRCRWCSCSAIALGAACGLLNGVPHHLGPGAGAGRDARDALRVPRPRVPVDRTGARSTPRRCPTPSSTSAPARSSASRTSC